VAVPLWFRTEEVIARGDVSFLLSEDWVAQWTSVTLCYPWSFGYSIGHGSYYDTLNIWLIPFGEYPDTLFHLADVHVFMEVDSIFYGRIMQVFFIGYVEFIDPEGYLYSTDIFVSPLCIECQTGADEPAPLPVEFVHSAYPNPFNSSIAIGFIPPQAGDVTLSIYDIMGRKVKGLYSGTAFGQTLVIWDGTDERGEAVSSGIYFYGIAFENRVFISKITMLR
jgi:hypothetical protein